MMSKWLHTSPSDFQRRREIYHCLSGEIPFGRPSCDAQSASIPSWEDLSGLSTLCASWKSGPGRLDSDRDQRAGRLGVGLDARIASEYAASSFRPDIESGPSLQHDLQFTTYAWCNHWLMKSAMILWGIQLWIKMEKQGKNLKGPEVPRELAVNVHNEITLVNVGLNETLLQMQLFSCGSWHVVNGWRKSKARVGDNDTGSWHYIWMIAPRLSVAIPYCQQYMMWWIIPSCKTEHQGNIWPVIFSFLFSWGDVHTYLISLIEMVSLCWVITWLIHRLQSCMTSCKLRGNLCVRILQAHKSKRYGMSIF